MNDTPTDLPGSFFSRESIDRMTMSPKEQEVFKSKCVHIVWVHPDGRLLLDSAPVNSPTSNAEMKHTPTKPDFTGPANDCARAIVAIVEKVTGQSLPVETCSRIVACVSIELNYSHICLISRNETLRNLLIEFSAEDSQVDRAYFMHLKKKARAALNPPPTEKRT